jgi:hypothetical protein
MVEQTRGETMRVKCKQVQKNIGPSETLIEIETIKGRPEEVIVHNSSLTDDLVEVYRIAQDGPSVLVELPRESVVGNWRIWIPQQAVVAG